MTTKVIEGNGFELRYDPTQVKVTLWMFDEDFVLLVLQFLEDSDVPIPEDKPGPLPEQKQENQ